MELKVSERPSEPPSFTTVFFDIMRIMNWGKGKMLLVISIAACAVALFFSAQKTEASEDHLVINEIYPNPSSGNEWIEFYNPTNSDIDLASYSIEDGTHNPKVLSGIILSGGYFVIEKTVGDFTFTLNNDKEIIVLKNNATIVDQVAFGDWDDGTNNPDNNAVAPIQGKSLSRIPNGVDTDIDKADFRALSTTRESENLLPVYSSLVGINEIVPQPATSSTDELIELYNSGNLEIDLSGWQIDDIVNGGSSPFTIPDGTAISPSGYLIFYNSDEGISCNDSADSVRLLDPNGEEKSIVSYSGSKRGQSYSKFSDGWQWSTTITPEVENILTIESEDPTENAQIIVTDIEGARNQPDETIVSVIGAVTVQPGKLSSQYFYIQDKISGIQIYCYKKEFPSLNLGDEIKIIGELDTIANERRIKISSATDIQILSTHPPPEPISVTIDDIDENYEGEYIEVAGTVSKTSGNTFYIHGSGEIEVVIRTTTGIKKPKMRVGDKVRIAGILSQYNDSYRILPTKQSDVKITSSSKLADTGLDYKISVVSALIAIIISWIISAKVSRKQRI